MTDPSTRPAALPSSRWPVLALLALLIAGSADAAPSISLIWTGTTGTGTPGSSVMEMQAGDVVTLDVILLSDTGSVGGALGLSFTTASLQAISATECPSPPNLAPGLCTPAGAGLFTPLQPGVTIDNVSGTILRFDAFNATPSAPVTSMTIGRAVFTVSGTGIVSTLYDPLFDGVLDGAGNVSFPHASTTPEPSTVALLAAGLGALGLARRRRR